MRILLATEVILPGGAETFVLRLASALQKRGHTVSVFVFYKDEYNKTLHESIAPDVKISWPETSSKLSKKIDGLFFRMNVDRSIRNKHIKKALYKTIKQFQPDVIHSNLLKVDKICTEVGNELNIPVVTTIHGDYLQFYDKVKKGKSIPLLNYKEKAKENLESLKTIVCISDKQINFFKEHFPEETKDKLCKIYNGYEKPNGAANDVNYREKLNIAPDDFVFGLASRGIKEKGWDVAIQAILQLKNYNAHLILIGGGEYLRKLKKKYSVYTNIHFAGHTDDTLQWINNIDVGLLPSTYPSESLPTVVIEYLCCGKPVIASDAGEIKNMIQLNGNEAGIIVPIKDAKVAVTGVLAAMQKYITDKEYYNIHKQNTQICFEQFNMDKCVDNYLQAYKTSK